MNKRKNRHDSILKTKNFDSYNRDCYSSAAQHVPDTDSSKCSYAINYCPDAVVVEGREYSKEEVLEILKKHKEEEDKKYHKCERCGKLYLQNATHNLVKLNFDKQPDNCSAWGYAVTPYIRGFKMLSTCGDGREVGLCDDCIEELVQWLHAKREKSEYD